LTSCIQAAFSSGGGGSAGAFTIDGTDSSTAGTSALTVSGMTGRDITQVLFHVANDGTNSQLLLKVNNVGANYNSRFATTDPSVTNSTGDASYILSESLANQDFVGEVLIFKANSNLSYTGNMMRSSVTTVNAGAGLPYQTLYGGGNNTNTAAITRIDLLCSSGNILGEIQVNSMDYQ